MITLKIPFSGKSSSEKHIITAIMAMLILSAAFFSNEAKAIDGQIVNVEASIRRTGSGARVLDADLLSINANGTKVQLWDGWGGNNQLWHINASINTSGTIVNAYSGKCLDADLGTISNNGTKVQLWDCSGGTNQLWYARSDGTIVNVYSGRCLDADLNTIDGNGTKVQLWDCWVRNNQKWVSVQK